MNINFKIKRQRYTEPFSKHNFGLYYMQTKQNSNIYMSIHMNDSHDLKQCTKKINITK